jgi:hypothetical protein
MIQQLLFFTALQHVRRSQCQQRPDFVVIVHCQLSPG